MFFSSLPGSRRWVAFLALGLFIFGTAAVANTGIQWGVYDQEKPTKNNPHLIPDAMDPKSPALSEEIHSMKYEIQEGEVADLETIHSIAMRDGHGQSQSVLDYTTGTSN